MECKKKLKDLPIDVIIKTEKVGKKTYYIAQSIQIDIVAQGLSVEESLNNLREIIIDRINEQPGIKSEIIEEEEKYPLITRIFL